MSKPSEMTPLPKDSIRLGVPVAHAIYDVQGNLLVQAGVTLKNQSQVDKLQAIVLFQDKKYAPGSFKAGAASLAKTDSAESEKTAQKEVATHLAYRDLRLGEMLQLKH